MDLTFATKNEISEKEKLFNKMLEDLEKNYSIRNKTQLRKAIKNKPLNIAVFTK